MLMILYHASKEIVELVEFPETRKIRYTKDFSWGFYCKMQKRRDISDQFPHIISV